jgi:hypothetical protein
MFRVVAVATDVASKVILRVNVQKVAVEVGDEVVAVVATDVVFSFLRCSVVLRDPK